MVKNSPANAGDIRDKDSISGWGRYPGVGNANCSRTLARRIPWTDEPSGLQFLGSESDTTELQRSIYIYMYNLSWVIAFIKQSRCHR